MYETAESCGVIEGGREGERGRARERDRDRETETERVSQSAY